MPTAARIALHHAGESGVRLTDVELADPTGHQVLVRIEATGVCRSQLGEISRHVDGPALPLGHEGIGTVLDVGDRAESVSIGDRVIVTWVPIAGEGIRADEGVALDLPDGTRTSEVRVYTWATHAVVDEAYLIRLEDDDVDPALSLVGCAVITGVGSAVHAGGVGLGDNVVVIGAGGVGLAAVAGAAAVGAATVAVVDIDTEKLEFARRFGATHTIDSTATDVVETVRSLMGRLDSRGADVVIDCVGATPTIETAIGAARAGTLGAGHGGSVVIAGLGGGELHTNASLVIALDQKSIVGTLAGGVGRHEIDQILRAVRADRIQVPAMVTDVFSFDDLDDAIERLRVGDILGRGIVVLADPQDAR